MELINHIIFVDGEARISSKPHLKAEMVARMYSDGQHTIEAVMEQYGLSAAEVHSALAYYYDHQEELDRHHDEQLREIRANAMTLEKFKAKLANRKHD